MIRKPDNPDYARKVLIYTINLSFYFVHVIRIVRNTGVPLNGKLIGIKVCNSSADTHPGS